MTTFQEPPLQSRRAARQNERADAPPGAFTDPNSVNQPPASPTAPSAPAASDAEPLNAEPLNYATTTRPPLPQYDGQNLRPRRTAETPGHGDLPPTEALPRQDAPSYRPKDYSPEGRRSVTPSWAPAYDGTVDFQTQNRDAGARRRGRGRVCVPRRRAAEGEHTMTRRELRALREADGITAVPTDSTPVVTPDPAAPDPAGCRAHAAAPVRPRLQAAVARCPGLHRSVAPAPEPVDLVTPPPLVAPAPQPSTRLDSALAEFDALAAGREPFVPAPDAPAPLPGRRAAQQPPTRPCRWSAAGAGPVPRPGCRGSGCRGPLPQAPVAQAPIAPSLSRRSRRPVTREQPQDALSTFESLFAAPAPAGPALPELGSRGARSVGRCAAARAARRRQPAPAADATGPSIRCFPRRRRRVRPALVQPPSRPAAPPPPSPTPHRALRRPARPRSATGRPSPTSTRPTRSPRPRSRAASAPATVRSRRALSFCRRCPSAASPGR